jgi:hypothetical protein
MEQDTDKPFSREPWQRLLQDGAAAPPETTDARIRKAARRALAPRASRWWLPASLAASVLLAVVIVDRQLGEREPAEVVAETDLARPQESATPDASAGRDDAFAPGPASEPRAPQVAREKARTEGESGRRDTPAQASSADEELGDIAVTGSRVRGPEREIEESSEMPMEEARVAESPQPYVAPPPRYGPTVAKSRPPEDWYAEIEKLRAAGRTEEADRELERLKAAHPGWLERHLENEKTR